MTCQVPARTCLFKVAFVNYQLKIIPRSFSLCVNFLLSLILQTLKTHFFVNITLRMEPSITITCFNQVAHKYTSKKVKGVLVMQVL